MKTKNFRANNIEGALTRDQMKAVKGGDGDEAGLASGSDPCTCYNTAYGCLFQISGCTWHTGNSTCTK